MIKGWIFNWHDEEETTKLVESYKLEKVHIRNKYMHLKGPLKGFENLEKDNPRFIMTYH